MPRKSKKNEPLREAKVVDTPEEFVNNSDIEGIGDDSMLMPNEGSVYAPEEQEDVVQERTEDQLLFNTNPAIIDAVFEWLDAEIAACDSVEATLILAKIEGLTEVEALHAMEFVRKIFTSKKVTFENIRDTLKA